MKRLSALMLAALLAGCGDPAPSESVKSTETVESLAANPERLKELRQQCKADWAKLGDELFK